MGGGKGGSQTTTVKLPEELEQGSVGTLGAALQSASLPYAANRGVTIADFAPQQYAAMRNAESGAGAFGFAQSDPSAQYLPPALLGAGGARGFSTGALYDQNVNVSMTEDDLARREALLQNYGLIGDKVLSGKRIGSVPVNKMGDFGVGGSGSGSTSSGK